MEKLFQLELTQLERNAIVAILINYSLQPDSTRHWINVTTNETVNFEDLLAKIIEEG